MKAFLREMTAALKAVWFYMKTINVYAGAIPDATECREYRTAEQWEHPTR